MLVFRGVLLFSYLLYTWGGDAITAEISLSTYKSATTFSTCSATKYFDTSVQSCNSCPTSQVPNPTVVDIFGQSVQCQCAQGYSQQTSTTTCSSTTSGYCQQITCTSCLSQGLTSYSDLSGCVGCDSTTSGVQSSTGDCACKHAPYQALIETDIVGNKLSNKTCHTCGNGSLVILTSQTIAGKYYTASLYSCQACPDVHMTMTYSSTLKTYTCNCNTGYTITGVSGIGALSCIPNAYITSNSFLSQVASASVVNFPNAGVTVSPSLVFKHYFLAAATYCNDYGGPQDTVYCQQLANLCVLQLYSGVVCSIFMNIYGNRANAGYSPTNNITTWGKGMPWIYFSPLISTPDICLVQVYSTSVTLSNFALQYVIASYALNGSFLGYSPLNDLFTSFCSVIASEQEGFQAPTDLHWQSFGASTSQHYTCSLRSLLNEKSSLTDQLFYELYLYDPNTLLYTPIPVGMSLLADNTAANFDTNYVAVTVNSVAGICFTPAYMIRRFYLADVVSGISTTTGDPQVIRYAANIYLLTELVPDTSSNGKIYTPVLNIYYAESQVSSWSETNTLGQTDNSQANVYLEVNYVSDVGTFIAILNGFVIANFVVMLIFFLIRYHNWNVRNSRLVTTAALTTDLGGANLENLLEIVFLALNSYVLIFFPFTVLITWYFFVFFKLQSVPSVMLPAQESVYDYYSTYYLFTIDLYMMTIFQVFYVLIIIVYRQSKADLFFIDWEPYRMHSGNIPGGMDVHKAMKRAQAAASAAAAAAAAASDPAGGASPGGGAVPSSSHSKEHLHQQQQVSIWRTIMVANEFSELQVLRRSDIRFTLFWLGFFLVGLDLQYNATPQPDINDHTPGQVNVFLRFANSTFFWLVISLAQYFWKYFLYERYFGEPPEQIFVDFCTLAKISIFVLDEKYHGFYIHCRSPHQYADATMNELVEMLHQEEAGLSIDRSLEGANADVQSFQIFLSAEMKHEFETINMQLAKPLTMAEMIDQRRNRAMQQQQVAMQQQRIQIQQQQQQQVGYGYAGAAMNLFTFSRRIGNRRLRSGGGGGGPGGLSGSGGGIAGGGGAGVGSQQGMRLGLLINQQHSNNPPPMRVLHAWREMMSFLQEFVENNFALSGLRRVIHEPSYYEIMTNSGPNLSQPNQPSVFYTDRDYKFTKVWFLGRELDLLLFNILTYSLFDYWFNNTLVSILLCYLMDYGIKKMRLSLGNAALSRKTLVDIRFLI